MDMLMGAEERQGLSDDGVWLQWLLKSRILICQRHACAGTNTTRHDGKHLPYYAAAWLSRSLKSTDLLEVKVKFRLVSG